MKRILTLLLLIVVFAYGCKESAREVRAQVIPRDTTIKKDSSYSELFFDSTRMEKFIAERNFHDSLKRRIRNFYNQRNYQYAWFFQNGLAEYAPTFYNIYNDYLYYSGDTALKSPLLEKLYDSISTSNFHFTINDSIVFDTEILLTAQFFRYARRAYQGRNQLNAQELNWYIPRKKINPSGLLDSLLVYKGENFSRYEPVNRQYHLLKDYLLKYYLLEKNNQWDPIVTEKRVYKLQDSATVLGIIKKRLHILGDYASADTTGLFNDELDSAVRNFQERMGLKIDGIIGNSFMNELNRPIRERIKTILINMERIRWVPAQPNTDYLLVNIPEFRLHVYDKGKYKWSTNVVVGTAAHNTVIFTGNLKYIVFSPYWNVPQSILRNEILPAIAKNKNYLARQHMEWNGNSVRQKPGPDNALGRIKFLFPNNYNIYLHDTPAKNLFEESKRTFSHGCIRVQEPEKLAEFILRNDPEWDTVKILKAMYAGKEKFYTIKDPIPVFIGYFTTWVDRDGKLNFRNDVYGHDKKMEARLFLNTEVE